MAECFKCSITGERARLFDAIGDEGIVKICEQCSKEEDIPIIKKPSDFKLKEAERRGSVYERLSRAAGLGPKIRERVSGESQELLRKQETTLRDIIDKNLKLDFQSQKSVKPREDLIQNFHWVIMRARRGKKITAEQLAREIGESVMAVKMAEKGAIPEGGEGDMLVNKLENALEIRLFKEEFVQEPQKIVSKRDEELKREFDRVLSFDRATAKALTISDLKQIEGKKQEQIFEPELEESESSQEPGEIREDHSFDDEIRLSLGGSDAEDKPEFINKEEAEKKDNEQDESESGKNNKDVSQKEVEDLIFRRGNG